MSMAKRNVQEAIALATITTSGAESSTDSDAVRLPGMINAFALVLDVTAAATDVGDTLDVKVQTLIDGTNWVDICHFTQVLGNGGAVRHVAKIEAATAQAMFADAALAAGNTRNLLGDQWRVNHVTVDADANSAFTFAVTACPM